MVFQRFALIHVVGSFIGLAGGLRTRSGRTRALLLTRRGRVLTRAVPDAAHLPWRAVTGNRRANPGPHTHCSVLVGEVKDHTSARQLTQTVEQTKGEKTMNGRKLLQQVFNLVTSVLLLAGCGGTQSDSPATAVPSTATPVHPTVASVAPTAIPIEQVIIGAWVETEGMDDPHNRRYHVYTKDGKYCFGGYLPALLEGESCKAYELDGNVLSEICMEENVGCTAGAVCRVEVAILEDGQLEYFVPEACPSYPSGHPIIGEPQYFTRVEEP